MPIESKPFYWVVCDWPGCDERSPGDLDEVAAWSDESQAIMCAEDSEWRATGAPLRVYCPDHANFICRECGSTISIEHPGEQDYLCLFCFHAPEDRPAHLDEE